jgi:hypothetical protein
MLHESNPVLTATELEADVDRATGADIDLTRLYRLWDENQRSAYTLDFSQDVVDWRQRFTLPGLAVSNWSVELRHQSNRVQSCWPSCPAV